MKKHILSFVLALTLLISLLPFSAAAASDATHEAEVRAAVTKMIKDYAKKVYQSGADEQAFKDYFIHGFFRNGRDMKLTEKSAMTAALFNSNLLQEALITEITAGILKAQELHREQFYGNGSTNWHNYQYSYGATGYLYKNEKYSGSVGNLVTPNSTTSTYYNYSGPHSKNDEVQELLSGGLNTSFELKQTQLVDGKAAYTVKIILADLFDFTGTYDDIAKKGYDTSKDEDLKDIGWLMTYVGLDEFDWSFTTTLKVEVPYNCDHTTHNYNWVYDGSTITVNSKTENGFEANPTSRKEYKYKSSTTGETMIRYYHKLEETVLLSHDRPWVVEWDQVGLKNHQFSPATSSSNGLPTIYSYSRYDVWLLFTKPVKLADGTQKTLTHYLGVNTTNMFKYYSTHRYTTTLENVVNKNGSNMFYLSIYDHDLGEIVVNREPMDELSYKLPDEEKRTVKDENSKLANGMDIVINYIGNKTCGLGMPDVVLELRIWENGKDYTPDPGVDTAPTCTNMGGKLHHCNDCGSDYLTDTIPALGHSFGDYVLDNNAGCTENGTQTRTCTRCGEKDSAEVPDTALGHSYGEYAYDNNATCTADGTQTRVCTRCGGKDTVTAADTATGHSYTAAVTPPTYTEQGYTTYTCHCGDSYKSDYVDVRKHSYVGVVTEPTCTEQGYTTYSCIECDDVYIADYTELAEHTPVIDPAVKPTCSEKGKTEGSHCGVCGYVIKKQALISTNDNHTMEESIVKMPTYDEPGQLAYICQYCGKTDYVEIPPLNKPIPDNPFTDVMESDWFYDPVLWAVGEGVTGGKTATTFAPNEGCTRAQVVTFLWAANGKPAPVSTDNPFTDVADNDWYYNAVLWAVEQGITGGISATEFGPNQTCTRAQIATFLWAAKGKMPAVGKSEFVDVADSEWYSTPIIWAKENDITGGIGDGKFGPNDTCTRAQVVTFLKKVYD